MEEPPCEVHSEDNKSLPDKTKRKLKTPFQVETLEKFYCDHKYPTEQLKSQMAEMIGLTEKQVSGWFCHRRLKDKRLSAGEMYDSIRQDRSSGVIQDRGSGHKQDSCGSRQEGDNNNNNRRFDLKEVESIPKHMIDNEDDDDDDDDTDTSSANSLPPQHRYVRHSNNVVPGDSRNNRPSGYLKLKVPAENPAVTAVKRQLNRFYRQDGPPLGVYFDPLPPGAFDSSSLNTLIPFDEPEEYYGSSKRPESVMRHEAYNCKMSFQTMKFIQGSDYDDCYNSKPKNVSHNIGKNSSSSQGVEAYCSGDISPCDDRRQGRMKIQIHKERRMSSYNEKMAYAKAEPLISQNDGPNHKRPFIPTNEDQLDTDDGMVSRKINKALKRDHDDHPQHQRKTSSSMMPTWTSRPKSRPAAAADQVPSSFSEDEDETALTSSS